MIVAPGANDTRAAKNATQTIPIVFTGAGSGPVTLGLVVESSSARRRRHGLRANCCPIGRQATGADPKETVPKLSRVARSLGIRRMLARRRFGKQANGKQKSWACSSIL